MDRGFCSIVLLGIVYVVSNVLGCSVLEPGARAIETGHEFETDDRKVYYTDVVVYGEVVGKVEGDYPFKGISGVHTVEFKVLCTYKGGPVPKTIYIAGMGNENGQIPKCPAAPLEGIKESIMFLKPTKKNDVFEIEFPPNHGDVYQVMDDFSITCNISLSSDSDQFCQDYPPLTVEEGCVSWTPIPPLPTPKPKVETTPEPEPESEEEQPEPTDGTPEPKVEIDDSKNGNNNQSDEGYKATKNGEDTSAVKSSDDENGSTALSASILASFISIFLTLVV